MNRINDILSRLKSQSDSEKRSSGALNATRFEQDLVSAINGETSISSYQSSRGMDIANRCVENMKKHFGGVKNAQAVSKTGVSGESVLTPIYKKFMCESGGRCSGDPKSDIIMSSQMHGKMQISIKKEGSAQIAAAQAGEANAVISAALGKDRLMVKTIRAILTETLSKDSYYKIRQQYADTSRGNPEDFDALLSKVTGLKTLSGSPTKKEIAEFNNFMQIIGVKEKISSSIRDYLAASSTRKKIFKEFASGEMRYVNKESNRRADWFMLWSESGTIEIEEIESFVDSHYGSFRMNIRDRGNESGGSLRIDIRESQEFLAIEKELHQEFDYYCLTEGVLDTTVNMIRSAGTAVANLYKTFISAVKSVLSFIAALFASGTATLIEFFGIETTDMSYSW